MKRITLRIKRFLNNKYISPLIRLLEQGVTPKEIALGVAVSATLGVFPVLGSTTLLTTVFALTFRMNLPLVQLVNFSVYPLQILLLVPFMKIGENIFRFAELKYSLSEILNMLSNDITKTIETLWYVSLQGIGAWLIIAPLASILLFLIIYKTINLFVYKLEKEGI